MQRHTNLPIRSGFSLIELLVSTTVMLLMVGGGLAAYINFNERQQLASAASELQTYMRSAQTRARSGDIPEGCTQLNGYNIQVPIDSSQVSVYAVCSGGNILRSEHNLTGEVTTATAIDMTFQTLHGGVIGAQTVTLEKNDRSYSFAITAGGEINQGNYNE